MSNEFRMFLNLVYSFAKQYISWYEKEIKQVANASPKVYNESVILKD